MASSLRSMRALASHSRTRLSSWRRVTRLLSTAPCRARRSRKKAFSSCTSASSQGMLPGRTLAHTALRVPVLTSPNEMALTLILTWCTPPSSFAPGTAKLQQESPNAYKGSGSSQPVMAHTQRHLAAASATIWV